MLVIDFEFNQYTVIELSGFVELAVTISGGSSTTPISVMVTTIEQSATGEEYPSRYFKLMIDYSNRIKCRF